MNSTNYFFTGKELDATTKLYYYGARYYHPSIARFTQPDPLEYSDMGIRLAGGENLKIFLKNPQNFNRYSYCLNNPLKYIDSYGLLTIYIPGTFSDYKTPKYDFMDTATKSFKDNYGFAALSWSGRDTFIAQANAALSLANFINNYNFASNENLNIVGFSHGGNIGLMASRLIWNHKIDNLVLLATPIRGYKMNRENIGKIYNFYSNYDYIQSVLGGKKYYLPSTPFSSDLEFGPAGRTIEGAININIPVNKGPVGTHFYLFTQECWDQYIKLEIN